MLELILPGHDRMLVDGGRASGGGSSSAQSAAAAALRPLSPGGGDDTAAAAERERTDHQRRPAVVRGVSWLPQYHDMGLVVGMLAPLVGGCEVALCTTRRSERERWRRSREMPSSRGAERRRRPPSPLRSRRSTRYAT
jgi:hypothetical protein